MAVYPGAANFYGQQAGFFPGYGAGGYGGYGYGGAGFFGGNAGFVDPVAQQYHRQTGLIAPNNFFTERAAVAQEIAILRGDQVGGRNGAIIGAGLGLASTLLPFIPGGALAAVSLMAVGGALGAVGGSEIGQYIAKHKSVLDNVAGNGILDDAELRADLHNRFQSRMVG